jgi:hypothetical protein
MLVYKQFTYAEQEMHGLYNIQICVNLFGLVFNFILTLIFRRWESNEALS